MKHNEARTSEQGDAVDPVLMAVIANRFDAIVREMTNTLFRTGRSAILNTAKDFSCSIVTADDQLLASVDGLQMHVMGAGLQTPCMREFHPDMAEGDAFLHNDPYLGNTHTADHTILVPVFWKGTHVFTASAKAHQADCGNAQPSTYIPFAKDLYEEGGLNFPCVRVQRNYEDNDDVIRMCRRRIRVPDFWYGDYLATIGAARIGEKRIGELIGKYGLETLQKFTTEWFDYSERRTKHAIAQLPAGRLQSGGCHDPLPGLPEGIPVTVTVEIKPDEGSIEVDLRDNIDCVPAGVNLSESCGMTGALIGVLNCLDPSIPRNQGTFRCIRVHMRDNCVVGRPRFPASCSMATTNVVNRLINATQRAFSQIADGYGLAEGAGSMGAGFAVVSGEDSRNDNAPYVNQLIVGNNGGPASAVCDGWITYAMPDCAATVLVDSIEIIEKKYPIHFRSQRLVRDTGGAGRFRGGPAGESTYGPRDKPMHVAYFAEYNRDAPLGTMGGLPGARSSVSKITTQGKEEPLPPIGLVELQPGEFIHGMESGGGGYGDPLERDPQRVLHDVCEGWISMENARNIYGVTLETASDGMTLEINLEKTRADRESLLKTRTVS